MRQPPVSYDHGIVTRSGNILVLHDGQPDVSCSMRVTEGRLAMEEDGDAVFTKAAVGISRDQVPTVAPMELADLSSPATAMARPWMQLAEDAGVSHISLSTLEIGAAGKIATDDCYFGGPANSGSPVALRPPLTGGLPFRLLSVPTMTS